MCLGICDVIVLLLLMNPQKSLLCIGKGGDPRHMGKVGEFWGAGVAPAALVQKDLSMFAMVFSLQTIEGRVVR